MQTDRLLLQNHSFWRRKEQKDSKGNEQTHGLVRRATLAYMAALAFIAFLSGTAHFVLDRSIAQQIDSAIIVNVAGRQRMLSQRIGFLARAVAEGDEAARQDFNAAVALMERSHKALISGNDLRIQTPLSPAGISFFFDDASGLNAQVLDFISAARAVAVAQDETTKKVATRALEAKARGNLLNELDGAVSLFEKEARGRVDALKTLHRYVLMALIATLVAEACLIFNPLIKRLKFFLISLYDSATRDPLTGVANRRYFMESAKRDLALARRKSEPLYVFALDIDHFKSVNDVHGHDVGDKALIAFANLVSGLLRESDLLGRLGGEEFAFTVRGAGEPDVTSLAEKIRHAVEKMAVPNLPKMTVSIGVSAVGTDETVQTALKRADRALYEAKRTGRNRVIVEVS